MNIIKLIENAPLAVLAAFLMFSCSIDEQPLDVDLGKEFIPEYPEIFASSNDSVSSPHLLTNSEAIALRVQRKGTYKISESEALEKFNGFAESNTNVSKTIFVKGIDLKKNSKTGKDMYYEIVFVNEKGTGFSLVSADERVPEVLCFIEKGSLCDTVSNKNLKFCLDLVEHYVEDKTKNELNIEFLSLTASEKLQSTVIKKDVAKKENNGEPSISKSAVPPFDPDVWTYEYSWWEQTYNECLKTVPVTWDQGAPYNALLPYIAGTNPAQTANVGCGMIAVAHIMAYHKKGFPSYISNSDWNNIVNFPYWTYYIYHDSIPDKTKLLMLKLFEKMKYGIPTIKGTTCTTTTTLNCLKENGYTEGSFVSYNFATVQSALAFGPTIIFGDNITPSGKEGHAWVIDGYSIKKIYYYDHYSYFFGGKLWEIDDCSGIYTTNKVCYSWGTKYGNNNGWFNSGVFEYDNSNNFNQNVYIINYIKNL